MTAATRIAPAVAGLWYPDDPASLERTVDELLGGAPRSAASTARPRAVVAPHAGFAYSGAVAAAGLVGLARPAGVPVVLLGPSHHVHLGGGVVPAAAALATPLGDVPVAAATRRLAESPDIRVDDAPFVPEHSLEAELPFLQRSGPEAPQIVPLLVGVTRDRAGRDAIARIAEALLPLWQAGASFVVSSDFTHYGPRFGYVPWPADRDSDGRIERLDRGAIDRLAARDPNGFADYCERTGATICGRDAIEVVLHLAAAAPPGAAEPLIAYDTSGRISGDRIHSVSYAAVRLS